MANSVRAFVIESLKGFYKKLPLKNVAVDGSVLTPDASGIVNLNVVTSEQLEEVELSTAMALNDLDTSIGNLRNNIGLTFDNIYDDLNEMHSDISGLENASPWIYGAGENSAVLRTGSPVANAVGAISHGNTANAIGSYSHAEGHGTHFDRNYTMTGDASATVYTLISRSGCPEIGTILNYGSSYAKVLSIYTISYINSTYTYNVTLDKTLSATTLNNATVYARYGAYGEGSHIEGSDNIAAGSYSHTEGMYNITVGNGSHAEGYSNNVFGEYSHAEGDNTLAYGKYVHSEGISTIAYSNFSHAEGYGIGVSTPLSFKISGDASTTTYTTSTAHSLKPGDIVVYKCTPYSGDNPIVLAKVRTVPNNTTFTVDKTLCQPYDISNGNIYDGRGIAYNTGSHSEGYGSNAIGQTAHAEGRYTVASGSDSHAEGDHTVTGSSYSHAEGSYTKTINMYEHAQGRYNMPHNVNSNFGNAGNTLNTIGIGTADNNRKNAVEVMQNGDVYITGIGNYDGSNYIDASTLQEVINNSGGGGSTTTDLMTSVTYSELKALRDSSSLVPGMQYHIYDYATTVGDASLSSAMHPFGIIVTANSLSELDENARICKVEDDEYYTNLDAYEIKYCIDNDSSRFGWADSNGKGIIYYMKDDNRNEAYYDFTNILFDNKYTFDYNGTDARLNASANIHDNVIGPHYGGYTSAGSQQAYYTLSPNNIIFEGLMNYNNTFGNDCYDMRFSNQTMFNTFDGAVWDCSFGVTTLYNHFGSYITGSIFPAKLATSDIGSNIQYVNVSGTTTPYIRCRIMPNTKGTSTSSRLSISITEIGQHAGLNSSGVLKKWLPADLID